MPANWPSAPSITVGTGRSRSARPALHQVTSVAFRSFPRALVHNATHLGATPSVRPSVRPTSERRLAPGTSHCPPTRFKGLLWICRIPHVILWASTSTSNTTHYTSITLLAFARLRVCAHPIIRSGCPAVTFPLHSLPQCFGSPIPSPVRPYTVPYTFRSELPCDDAVILPVENFSDVAYIPDLVFGCVLAW